MSKVEKWTKRERGREREKVNIEVFESKKNCILQLCLGVDRGRLCCEKKCMFSLSLFVFLFVGGAVQFAYVANIYKKNNNNNNRLTVECAFVVFMCAKETFKRRWKIKHELDLEAVAALLQAKHKKASVINCRFYFVLLSLIALRLVCVCACVICVFVQFYQFISCGNLTNVCYVFLVSLQLTDI